MTDVGRTEAGPEARDAARTIVERHGTSDCSCLRDEFPCEKCHMAIEDIVAALSRPAAQAATEMRGRAATLIEAAARGIRVEAGDAIDDALAARLVQMVAGYADAFAAAIRALPIESARPAAPEDEEIAPIDMRRALLAARPVLEACRKLFGGRGMHGPGALEDDCAFALRQIDAALKATACEPASPTIDGAGRYRKKPVVVEAIQWSGDNAEAVSAFVGYSIPRWDGSREGRLSLALRTVTGHAEVYLGDWIIREPNGDGFYPCRAADFAATYESVLAAPSGTASITPSLPFMLPDPAPTTPDGPDRETRDG